MNATHPIVMPDGRVPCDCCDSLITKTEAESNFPRWQQRICNSCALDLAEANPDTPQLHTPEPWHLYENGPVILSARVPHAGHPERACMERIAIATGDSYRDFPASMQHENMRRIVACVNACDGIPTEVLQGAAFAKIDDEPLYELVRSDDA